MEFFFFFNHGEMPSENKRRGGGAMTNWFWDFCWAGIGIDGKGGEGGDENVM